MFKHTQSYYRSDYKNNHQSESNKQELNHGKALTVEVMTVFAFTSKEIQTQWDNNAKNCENYICNAMT